MNAQIVWMAVQFEETKRSNKSIVRCKFIDLRQYFHTHLYTQLYTYVYDGVSNHRAQQLHAEARALFDLHHNHLGWLGTLHALNCIVSIMPVFLRCRRRLLLTLIPCCCSLQLSMVVVLVVSVVVVLHECTGCSSPRQRVGESLKQVSFQPPHRSVASCTTICNLLCKYFATVLVLRCCSGSVPSPPLRSSPVAVQLLHSGR